MIRLVRSSLTYAIVCCSVFAFTDDTTSIAMGQGLDGIDGDPATNGENGVDGATTVWRGTKASSAANLTIFGRNGTHGGNGGNGIDGNDPDSTAQAGNGGDGGKGGSIVAILQAIGINLDQKYTAGRGGSGGAGGLSSGLPNGLGGDGSRGGNIYSELNATGVLKAELLAGKGGSGVGVGQNGGAGGNSQAKLQTTTTTGTPSPFQALVASIAGGEAGFGLAAASGGRGGDSVYLDGQVLEFDAQNHRVEINAYGGVGGYSRGGRGGDGGFSRIYLPEIQLENIDQNTATAGLQFNSTGGIGGRSYVWNSLLRGAGNAGAAQISQIDSNFRTALSGPVIARANGGLGGRMIYDNLSIQPNSFKAGNGGDAIISGTRLQSAGQNAGTGNKIFYLATGGNGGENQYGFGGNGGAATNRDHIIRFNQFNTIGELTADGGVGGNGRIAGAGGNASVVNNAFYGTSGSLDLLISATGGKAGISNSSQSNAGGNATISHYFHGQGDAQITGTAIAGESTFGIGGTASSTITAVSEGLSLVRVSSTAKAHGFAGTSRYGINTNSSALAVTQGGNAFSTSISEGGLAWETTGSAKSMAVAVSQTGNALATARSTTLTTRSLQGVNSDLGRFANSYARARGVNVNANATAIAYGENGNPHARASIDGLNGTATASALGGSQFYNSESGIELVVSSTGMVDPILVDSQVRYLGGYTGGDPSATVRAGSFVSGDASTLQGIENIALNQQFDFGTGNFDLLNAFEFRTQDAGAAYNFDLSFSANSDNDATTRNTYAFFYDLESISGGLEALDIFMTSGSNILLDKSFNNGDAAMAFLDGWYVQTNTNIVISASGRSGVGESFQLRLGFAGLDNRMAPASFKAVPEPDSSWLITAFIVIGVSLVRRRFD